MCEIISHDVAYFAHKTKSGKKKRKDRVLKTDCKPWVREKFYKKIKILFTIS